MFTDKSSSSDPNRPALQTMPVLVHEIGRLARNTVDLLSFVKQLTDKGVTITFKKERLTFTGDSGNAVNQLVLTMLGAVAEFELSIINERRIESRAKAREAGTHMGRHAKLTAARAAVMSARVAAGESKTDLATEYGISRATLYASIKASSAATTLRAGLVKAGLVSDV